MARNHIANGGLQFPGVGDLLEALLFDELTWFLAGPLKDVEREAPWLFYR
jgi:hypothetical protein